MKKYKIAILTAYIGNGGDSELSFTMDAMQDLNKYGVDIYFFNNNNVEKLKPFFNSTFKKEDIYYETTIDKLSNWFIKNFGYKQSILPTATDNYTRLIAKIPKIKFYNLVPEKYDFYIWLDSKFTIHKYWLEYIIWLIESYSNYDIITSKHSARSTIKEELYILNEQITKYKTNSFLSKYNINEIKTQVKYYLKAPKFNDNILYELGMIIYHSNILGKKEFLEEWYSHNYYLSIQDQLSFPYLCQKHNINVIGINHDVCNMPFATHIYGLK